MAGDPRNGAGNLGEGIVREERQARVREGSYFHLRRCPAGCDQAAQLSKGRRMENSVPSSSEVVKWTWPPKY
jgi:hypothetical protein